MAAAKNSEKQSTKIAPLRMASIRRKTEVQQTYVCLQIQTTMFYVPLITSNTHNHRSVRSCIAHVLTFWQKGKRTLSYRRDRDL